MSGTGRPLRLTVVSAGTSDPSTTSLLAGRLAERTVALGAQHGVVIELVSVELRSLAREIVSALVSGLAAERLGAAREQLRRADGLIAATPVYKAGLSGLFKSFFDTVDDDLLIAKPVLLAATAGSERHALVVDQQLRALFAYLRALSVPTSVFAASGDWADPALSERIERAALELLTLMRSGVAQAIEREGWSGYEHELDGVASRDRPIELDSELMRLAAGGREPKDTPGER